MALTDSCSSAKSLVNQYMSVLITIGTCALDLRTQVVVSHFHLYHTTDLAPKSII